MSFKLVYITTPNLAEAEKISAVLLKEGMIACANIISGIQSMYKWEGGTKKDEEVLLLCKSTSYQLPHIVKRVKELHTYDVPCITSFPIFGGNPEYLHWISRECTYEAEEVTV